MAINLADNNPRIVYSVAQGVSQTVFAVPFEFFEDSDINVYVDGVGKTEGADYTLSGGSGSTGTLTFTSAVTGASGGSTVVLFRRIAIERTTDFQIGQDINRTALNEQLDTLTALVADMNDRWDRAVHINDFDTGSVNFVLPPKASRAGNYFAFDVNGDPVMTTGTTSDIIVSAYAETLLGADSGAEFLNQLDIDATPTELNLLDGMTGKTGSDLDLVTGTAGSNGQYAQWNADGDIVGVDIDTLDQADWNAGTSTTEALISPAKLSAATFPASPYRLFSDATTTPAVDIYSADKIFRFEIFGSIPSFTTGTVSLQFSTDGGSTWGSSQQVFSGNAIPFILIFYLDVTTGTVRGYRSTSQGQIGGVGSVSATVTVPSGADAMRIVFVNVNSRSAHVTYVSGT